MGVALLATAVCITACAWSNGNTREQQLSVRQTRVAQIEDHIDALQIPTQLSPSTDLSPATTQPQIDEAAEKEELHFRCEPDFPDGIGRGCGLPTLVEYWATRGIRAIAPANWHDSLRDGMGSGSSAEWWNPDDPEEQINVSTGVSKGMWYEIDEVEGSINPELMVPETADIYPQSRTVFVYVDSEDDMAILGVFRVFPNGDDPCCYYQAEIRLRYENGGNAHFWNMFLHHQLQVVAGTDFAVEFQYHELGQRFRNGGNNGNKILFTRNCWECKEGIFVMNADGTGVGQLTDHPFSVQQPILSNGDYDPVWSPDGTKIAFERISDSCCWSAIFVMNADGTGIQQLTNNDSYDSMPVWSPDGTKIAFARGKGIFVVNADGTGIQQLTDPRRPKSHDRDSDPVWSPDGTKMAFEGFRDSTFGPWGPYGDTQIFVMNADGTGIQQLTDNEYSNDDPVWSPDGTKIAFNGLPDGHLEMFVMNADGSNVIALGPGTLFSWGG